MVGVNLFGAWGAGVAAALAGRASLSTGTGAALGAAATAEAFAHALEELLHLGFGGFAVFVGVNLGEHFFLAIGAGGDEFDFGYDAIAVFVEGGEAAAGAAGSTGSAGAALTGSTAAGSTALRATALG